MKRKQTIFLILALTFLGLMTGEVTAATTYNVEKLPAPISSDKTDIQINNKGQVVWSAYNEHDYSKVYFYDGINTINLSDKFPYEHDNDFPIYGSGYGHDKPQINDNGQVVWACFYNNEKFILFWDGTSPHAEIIESLTLYDGRHNLNSRGQVIWSMGGDIFLWDSANGTQKLNTTSFGNGVPQINDNGQVIWQGSKVDSSNMDIDTQLNNNEIYLWDSASGVQQLTDNNAYDRFPMFNASGQVVWMQQIAVNGGSEESNIILRDSDNVSQNLTDGLTGRFYRPQINDSGQVVWYSYPSSISKVFLWDSVNGVQELTNSSGRERDPMINSSGQIVWRWWNPVALQEEVIVRDVDGSLVKFFDVDPIDPYNSNSQDPLDIDFTNPRINDNGQVVMLVQGYEYFGPNNSEYRDYSEIYLATPDSNAPPIADAGDNQSIHVGEILLDGRGSHDDRNSTDELLFDWSFVSVPAESTATEQVIAAAASSSFIADVPGDYVIKLIVTDTGGLESSPSTVTVTTNNTPPNADAGPDQGSYVGKLISLDGSASLDPDFDNLTFSWSMVAMPAGSTTSLVGGNTSTPSLVPNVPGVYAVELIVNDGYVDSAPSSVTIVVISAVEFAEINAADTLNLVTSLPKTSVSTAGNQKALGNFLLQAIQSIQGNKIDKARQKLADALERTDGCALRGTPDQGSGGHKKDYVTDCADQSVIYSLLTDALSSL